jgi:hypothetical protein
VNGTLAVGSATSDTVTVGRPPLRGAVDSGEFCVYLRGRREFAAHEWAQLLGPGGLLPGVINQSQGSALTTGGRSTNDSLSINGMATARSFYAVDGIWNENTGNMTQQSVIPNPDSIEEVRVLQNNFSSQYSLLGSSVVLVQTKSGTNSFMARSGSLCATTI